jgi:hypothetical protein
VEAASASRPRSDCREAVKVMPEVRQADRSDCSALTAVPSPALSGGAASTAATAAGRRTTTQRATECSISYCPRPGGEKAAALGCAQAVAAALAGSAGAAGRPLGKARW